MSTEHLGMDENKYYDLVQKAFNTLAPYYDWVALPLIHARETVVTLTAAAQQACILDVATGTGQQALAFARRGYPVTGIDLSEAMLRVARKNNRQQQVQFELGNATQLRFGDATFDVVCISFALHDMPRSIQVKVVQEMARVVKPDGKIVIVDYALPRNKVGSFITYRLVSLYEGEYYPGFIHSDLKAMLANGGIQIINERPIILGAGRILLGNRGRQ